MRLIQHQIQTSLIIAPLPKLFFKTVSSCPGVTFFEDFFFRSSSFSPRPRGVYVVGRQDLHMTRDGKSRAHPAAGNSHP